MRLKGEIIMGRRFSFLLRAVLLVLPATMLFAACGGGNSDDDLDGYAVTSGESMPAASAAGNDALAYYDETTRAQAEEEQGEPIAGQPALDRLVIRTAQLTLTVDDSISASGSVRNLAISKGGFVFSSTTYMQDDYQYAQLTLRVPSDRFDELISDLRSAPYVTEVTREESSSQDVSTEYVDNESRLTALEETQRRYLALLSDAKTVDEILRLEGELTNVRTQIESLKGRQKYLDEMTAYSTITVTLRPAGGVEADPDDGFALTRIIQSAWDRSTGALAGIVEAIVVVLIFAAFFAPFAGLLYVIVRYARRRLPTRITE